MLNDNHVAHLGVPMAGAAACPEAVPGTASGLGGISARLCWAIRASLGCGQRLGRCGVGQRCGWNRSGAARPLQTWYRTRRGTYQCEGLTTALMLLSPAERLTTVPEGVWGTAARAGNR